MSEVRVPLLDENGRLDESMMPLGSGNVYDPTAVHLTEAGVIDPLLMSASVVQLTNDGTIDPGKLPYGFVAAEPGTTSATIRLELGYLGDAQVRSGQMPMSVPFAVRVVRITATCMTYPLGADLIFDINANDSSIAATPADRLTIPQGTFYADKIVSYGPLTANTRFTVDIDQIGTTGHPGGNIAVAIYIVPV